MRRLWIALGIAAGILFALVLAVYLVLASIDWNQYKAPVAEAVRNATGRELDLSGDLSIAIGWSPGVSVGDVSFENAKWGSQPEMARVESLLVQFELLPLLAGRVNVHHIELRGADLLLETRADGVANWQFESPTADSPTEEVEDLDDSEGFRFEIQSVAIDRSRIRIRDLATESERSIEIERLDARERAGAGPVAIELIARIDEEPIELRGDIPMLSTIIDGGPLQFDLDLSTGQATASFEGGYDGSSEPATLSLSLESRGEEVAGWGVLAQTELPHLGAYRLAARIAGKGDHYEIRDLEIGMGDSQLAGEVDLDLGADRPHVRAKLSSPRLDLADLQEPAPEAADDEEPKTEDRVFSDEPLPLDALSSVDAQITLAADLLRTSDVELRDFSLALALEDGRLRADPITFGVADGDAKLSLEVDSRPDPPRVALVGSANRISTTRFLTGTAEGALEGGLLDLRLDLRGRGRSIAEIASTLDGPFVLDLSEVRLENAIAGLALADLRSMLLGSSDVRAVNINCVLADFTFEDGIGRPKGLVIDLPSVAVFGSGSLDLGQETLDLRFDREGKGVSASQAMPPFRLRGTFADPKTRVDATRIAGRVADLGANVLTGDVILDWKEWPEGCPEILAAYEKARTEPSEAEKAVRKGGQEAFDALKGLLRKD